MSDRALAISCPAIATLPAAHPWQDTIFRSPWDNGISLIRSIPLILHGNQNEGIPEIPQSQVQDYVTQEIKLLFEEEGLAFEFHDGIVQRQGRHHTVERISAAQKILGDQRLKGARDHYNKARRFFQNAEPDYENAVKEAVCAVEAAGKGLFPEAKAKTLGQLASWLNGHPDVPKTIGDTVKNIYAYRSGGEGIAHGGAAGGRATAEVAEYILAVCASQMIYLFDLASAQEDEIPF